ncbi:MAG TPA: 50S ribosomal protein L24 [Chloroflexi bacterium]|nr:50S ribosomal protein L24 [Chloroflexota bacterium]
MKVKIRKGDTVLVIAGRDKGKKGEVIRVLPRERRVVVQGVNIRKKHQQQVQAQGQTITPGIIEFEAPIDISNVMLVCPKCGEATRVGVHRTEGIAERYCKRCGAVIE